MLSIYIYKSVVPRFIGVRGSEKRGGRREEKSDRKRGCPWGLCYSVRFVGNRKTKSGSKIHEKKGGRNKKKRTFVEDRKNGRKLYRVVSFFFFHDSIATRARLKLLIDVTKEEVMIKFRLKLLIIERRSDDQISRFILVILANRRGVRGLIVDQGVTRSHCPSSKNKPWRKVRRRERRIA